MRKTVEVFICDLCKKEIYLPEDSESPLNKVGIYTEACDEKGKSKGTYITATVELCDDCAKEYAGYIREKYIVHAADYHNVAIAKRESVSTHVPEESEICYYCPVTLTLTSSGEYGEAEEKTVIYGARYQAAIKDALAKENKFVDERSLAKDSEAPNVSAVRFDVKAVGDVLYGCIHVKTTAPFRASEEKEFLEWLEGQCSDGFGEGFEQREIHLPDGIGYLNFWKSYNWWIKTEEEFAEYSKH